MRDDAGKSRGFGFVCFKEWTSARAALDKHAVDGKPEPGQLYVAEAKSKEQRKEELARSSFQFKRSMQLLNLIVRNMSPETTKEEFEEFFGQFGEIRSSKLVPESQIGFVCYTDRESARKAKEMSGTALHNYQLRIDYCEPKEQRQKALEEKWDKRAFEKQRLMNAKGNNQDVMTLITSLSLLMSQLAGNGQGMARMANPRGQGQHQSSRHFAPAAMQMQGQAPSNQGPQGQQRRPPMPRTQQPMMGHRPMPQAPMANQPVPQVMSPEMHMQQQYAQGILATFQREEFMTGSEEQRKQLVGSYIFRHVGSMVGTDLAPKITGMIIDLPAADLNMSVQTFESLIGKVRSAVQLLVDTNYLPAESANNMPMNQHMGQMGHQAAPQATAAH